MLDSTPSTRSSYLHSSSTPPQHTLVSIRNAIASESQRIRVQDESTGQSYELELGKGMPYPERFGSEGDEERRGPSRKSADAGSSKGVLPALGATPGSSKEGGGGSRPSSIKASKLGSVLPLTSSSSSSSPAASSPAATTNGPPAQNGSAKGEHPPPQASSSSSPMRMLKLPAIVRSRHSNSSSASNNGAVSASQQQPPQEKASQPSSSTSTPRAPSRPTRSDSSVSTGGAQLQELNKQYHETLAANQAQAQQVARRTSMQSRGSRSSKGPGSQQTSPSKKTAAASSSTAGAAAAGRAPQQQQQTKQAAPPQPQFVASPRHYPVMSELPPSPPLDDDVEMNGEGSHARQLGGSAVAPSLPPIDTTNVPPAAQRIQARRQPSAASTADSVYMSADESGGAVTADEEEGEQTPTTPTQRSTLAAQQLSSSPTRMSTSGEVIRRSTSPSPSAAMATSPRTRALSSSPPSSKGLLHPSSARPPASQQGTDRSPSSSHTSRFQPLRRNTADSFSSSPDSATSGPRSVGRRPSSSGGIARRLSKDIWMPGMGPQEGASTTSGAAAEMTASPSTLASPLPASASMSSGPLRTGDAGFDEEIARQEALIRKRKERARRDEEEKEKEKKGETVAGGAGAPSASTGGGGGMPLLIRGKSGLGKFGGGGEKASTSGPLSSTNAGAAAAGSAAAPSATITGTQSGSAGVSTATTSAPGPSAATVAAAREHEEEKALVGNIINEGHVNYVLMYNMLTGIRIGVSRCQAKLKRPLRDEDYQAKHKFTFDIIGNELTPSAKYDFKFKDYAPWVFRELREYFYLDPADYLLSLTAKYILSELGSPGKSGSFFYFSRDYRFIIKTIRHSEHKFLRRILKDYHEHVKANPHTLLSRFYGLHRVKLPHGRKIHFVIMNNLFPPHRDVHETYDLKGSSYGREYPEERARVKKGATLKDINWIRRRRELELGPEKRGLFEAQLQSDVALLKRLKIMDYSLLIGLHDMRKGNSENLREGALQVVQPSGGGTGGVGQMTAKQAQAAPNGPLPSPAVAGAASAGTSSAVFGDVVTLNHQREGVPMHLHHPYPPSAVRRGSSTTVGTSGGDEEFFDATESGVASPIGTAPGAASSSGKRSAERDLNRANTTTTGGTKPLLRPSTAPGLTGSTTPAATSSVQLPARETSERRHFLFYQDEGGFRSTDSENQPGDWIYYLGIIDLFTPYSAVKRGENWWKSIGRDSRGISAVPPKQYGERFVRFLSAVVRPMRWRDLPPGFEKVEAMVMPERGGGEVVGEKEKGRVVEGEAAPALAPAGTGAGAAAPAATAASEVVTEKVEPAA